MADAIVASTSNAAINMAKPVPHLLRLPAEIRLSIFEYYSIDVGTVLMQWFEDNEVCRSQMTKHNRFRMESLFRVRENWGIRPISPSGLRHSCRQLRAEYLGFLAAHYWLDYDSPLRIWLKKIDLIDTPPPSQLLPTVYVNQLRRLSVFSRSVAKCSRTFTHDLLSSFTNLRKLHITGFKKPRLTQLAPPGFVHSMYALLNSDATRKVHKMINATFEKLVSKERFGRANKRSFRLSFDMKIGDYSIRTQKARDPTYRDRSYGYGLDVVVTERRSGRFQTSTAVREQYFAMCDRVAAAPAGTRYFIK